MSAAPSGARPGAAWLPRAEAIACFAILALMSGALLAPLFAPDQKPDSVPWLRTIWLPVYGGVAGLLLVSPLRMSRVVLPAVMGLILVGWALASYRWSIAPDLTLRRSVALLFTTVFGLHLASRYAWRDLIGLFAGVFLVLAVGSYVASLLFPGFGVHATIHPGAWKGLWYEKNELGGQMVLGTLACASAAIVRPEQRRLWIFGAILAAGLVIASTSTTALLGLLIVCGGLMGLALLRRGGAVAVFTLWTALAGAAAFLAVVLLAPDVFFALVGKDATLTGRVPIWIVVLDHVIPNRPLLGYGFNTYFIPTNPDYLRLVDIVGWPAPHAHNGYLNLAVELGLPGAALGVLILLRLLVGAVRSLNDERASWALQMLVFAISFAILNMVEASLLRISDNWEYTLLFCCFAMWKYRAERRLAAPPTARRWGEFGSIKHTELK
jgi:O-antigen ligase